MARPISPALLPALILMCAAGVAHAVETGRVDARVEDASTGSALAGAELYVELGGSEPVLVETDADGWARGVALPAGTHAVGVAAAGYARQTVEVVVPAGGTVTLSVGLQARGTSAFETVVTEVDRNARVPVVVGSVTRVDEEELRQRSPVHANEVLRTLPGVHVVDEDASGLRQSVAVRGLNPNRSRRVLMLEDGAPIGSAPYMDPDMYYTPPIERVGSVEVAKGADTILHGPQTIGGVINYLGAPIPERMAAGGEVRMGNRGYASASMMAGGTVGRAGARLDVVYRRVEGPRAVDARVLDVSLRGRLQLMEGATLTLRAGVFAEDSRGTYAGLTVPQFRARPDANFATHDRYRLGRVVLTARHVHELGPALRLEVLGYAHHQDRHWRRQEFDRAGTGGPYERVVPPGPGRSPTEDGGTLYFVRGSTFRNRQVQVAGVEPRVFLKLGPWLHTRHELVAGARLHAERYEETNQAAQEEEAEGGEVTGREVNQALALAGFAQYRLTIADALHATAGARVESVWSRRHVVRARERGPDGVERTVNADAQATFHVMEFIPGVGLSYAPVRDVLLFAGVHRGFAPPRTREAITPDGDNLRLGAETSWNLEAGVRAVRGRYLRAEAAVFHIDFQNQVVPSSQVDQVGQTGRPLVNGGRTRQSGAELSGMLDVAPLWNLPGRLSFTGALTLVDSRFSAGPFRDLRVPYTPPFTASGTWNAAHPAGLEAQASATVVGPQFSDNANTQTTTRDGLVGPLPGYITWDARLGLNMAPLPITPYVAVKNVADTPYIASRFPQGINASGFRQVLVGVRAQL